MKRCNRIWIELDIAIDPADAEKQCELANKMLTKLCVAIPSQFFVTKGTTQYCFGGDHGYEELPDRGKWFNLDYLAGD